MNNPRETAEQELFSRFIQKGWWKQETQAQRLEMQAACFPDKLAVTDDKRALTFRELAERSRGYAAYLLSRGLKKGDTIVIQQSNAVSCVEILYACFQIGVIPVPMLMSYREVEIQGVIRLVKPVLYISEDSYMGYDYASLARRCIAAEGGQLPLLLVSEWEAIIPESILPEHESPVYTDCSIIVSSGGSTGIPKLIERSHANYMHCQMTCAQSIHLSAEDIILIPMPLMHCWNLCGPGLVGSLNEGCTVILSRYGSPDEIMRLTEKYHVTVMALVPALMQACIEYRKYDTSEDISSLRIIQAGGSVCPPELVRHTMETLGCTVQQIYGMSEGFVSATAPEDDFEIITATQGYPVSEGSEMKIVDASGKEVPEGTAGELLVRGPSCVTSYYRSPEFTKNSFTDDLFYRTGDEAVFVYNGRIRILGRVVELINRCGEKITPSEVEEMLLKIDSVSEAAVVGGADAALGQRICAYVVSSEPLQLAQVRTKLSEMGLASHKLPDRLEVLSQMPHTGVNKINKKLLQQKANQE